MSNEIEWEYAAKGGDNYKYAGSDDVTEIAGCGSVLRIER